MAREIFGFGGDDGPVLVLEQFEKNLGLYINYRYSKPFQVHRLTVGKFALVWRIRAYRCHGNFK
jgi:hypothetical protein